MTGAPVYLDYQATTPIDPSVREAMMPFLGDLFGNPHSSDHSFGWEAARAIKDARVSVAALINADDDEIVFTSGATESCNLALRGIANRSGNRRRSRIVTLATEHPAVLETVQDLGRSGFDAIVLPVDADGLLNLDHLDKVLDEQTLIVSVMAANNEIGVLQPVAEIAARCHGVGALFHTDATQAAGRIPIDVDDWDVDLLSFSSHKVYGPKGVGALFVRSGVQLKPIITGGSQERGIRGGTLPPALIAGFGAACEVAMERQEEDRGHMETLTRRLGGLREVRGNRSVYVDCPFARAWWRERFATQAAGGDARIASSVRAVLRTNQTYWEKLIDRIVFRNSTFGSENIRSAFLRALARFVQADPTSNLTNSGSLQRLCRRATTYQGARELSILDDSELDALTEAVVTET